MNIEEIEKEIWDLIKSNSLPVLVYLDLLNNLHYSIEYKVYSLKEQLDNLENDREDNG